MPESAEEVCARVAALVGDDGRLATPDLSGDVFPWEAEAGAIVVKRLAAPAPERARGGGAGGAACVSCGPEIHGVIWDDDSWRVKHPPQRTGLPLTLFLETKAHLDFTDLDDRQAAEFGQLAVRLTRVIESLPEIGRCYVERWGDGSEHCHLWFTARTARLPSTRGPYALEWGELIPPGPEEIWRADLAEVARKLALHGGRAHV